MKYEDFTHVYLDQKISARKSLELAVLTKSEYYFDLQISNGRRMFTIFLNNVTLFAESYMPFLNLHANQRFLKGVIFKKR